MAVISLPLVYAVRETTALDPLARAQTRSAFRLLLGDVELEWSALNFRLRYAGDDTISVTVPGLDILEESLPTDVLTLYRGDLRGDGSWINLQYVGSFDQTEIDYSQSVRDSQVTFSGSRAKAYGLSGIGYETLGLVSVSGKSDGRSVVCVYDSQVKPGDTLVFDLGEIIVGSVSHTAGSAGLMTVEELTADAEEARANAEALGVVNYPELLV